jgi:hypothetical protein
MASLIFQSYDLSLFLVGFDWAEERVPNQDLSLFKVNVFQLDGIVGYVLVMQALNNGSKFPHELHFCNLFDFL